MFRNGHIPKKMIFITAFVLVNVSGCTRGLVEKFRIGDGDTASDTDWSDDAGTETDTVTYSETDTDTVKDSVTDNDTQTDSGQATDTVVDSDSDTETDSEKATDTVVDSDTQTDTGTATEPENTLSACDDDKDNDSDDLLDCGDPDCLGTGICECVNGSTQMVSCGNLCGEANTTCIDGSWGPLGECQNEGVCEVFAEREQDCGSCRVQKQMCQADCTWGEWGTCDPIPGCVF